MSGQGGSRKESEMFTCGKCGGHEAGPDKGDAWMVHFECLNCGHAVKFSLGD